LLPSIAWLVGITKALLGNEQKQFYRGGYEEAKK